MTFLGGGPRAGWSRPASAGLIAGLLLAEPERMPWLCFGMHTSSNKPASTSRLGGFRASNWLKKRKNDNTPSEVQTPTYQTCQCRVMAAAHLNRSDVRCVSVAFRLSRADREELKRRASQQGISVQAYLERVALGRADASDLPPGPTRTHKQEDLLIAS
jgi:predicted DNA binding CopG/RHH family protein